MSIDLRYVLAALVGDPNFLRVTEEMIASNDTDRNHGVEIISQTHRRYMLLSPGSTVMTDESIIPMAREIIPKTHLRRGVQGDLPDLPSSSLLATVALLLRPELRSLNQAELIPELRHLNEFLKSSITNNTQIDTIKNTAAMKRQHETLNNQIAASTISGDLIQRLANILEVNILVAYLDAQNCVFYWASGKAHSHLNTNRDLWCISCLDNRCEPILCNCEDQKRCMQACYRRIFEHTTLKHWIPISLGFPEISRLALSPENGIAYMKYYEAPKPISEQELAKLCKNHLSS